MSNPVDQKQELSKALAVVLQAYCELVGSRHVECRFKNLSFKVDLTIFDEEE